MFRIASLLLASALVLAGCGGDDGDDATTGPATLYFHNQLAASSATDVSVSLYDSDGNLLLGPAGYTTGSAETAAPTVSSDSATSLLASNDSGDLVTRRLNLQPDSAYTLVLMGSVSGATAPSLAAFQQFKADLGSDQIAVSFIHAAPSLADTVLTVATDVSVAYGKATRYYQDAPDGSGNLSVTVKDDSDKTLATLSCPVKGGNTYDAIIAQADYDDSDLALYCQKVGG
ncbi:hypothetical protein A11A3_11538 [Alcanivorax hongdengensis A-11-3]|uniref:DUF4397 domain-containing protein n=1 Tax=Alcanivorax hongdengensis A-11-3 TaxID=1177179 RepID=L0WA11_9GAMM|nr:DUF4397 domain-containing protein [Alcanivorax hongdengensis]EKF73839.1 hypothetical protein A11A3_11538 [Alcanivorax hongdengensis A-11-3]